MRLALRVAYDGTCFSGSQRQPGRRTVEGDLLDALVHVQATPDAAAANLRAAGRTDAGVSAAGNVFAVEVDFEPEALPRAVQARLSDAWVLGVAEVDASWNPRFADDRRYAYFAPVERGLDVEAAREALAAFVGEHDFTSFARLEPGRDPRRRVDEATLVEDDGLLRFDVRGRTFLWNQVRRMVAAVLAVGHGRATVEEVRGALAGKRVDLGVAPAEGLVLLEVRHRALRWRTSSGDAADVARRLAERSAALRVRLAKERAFLDALGLR